LSGWFGFAKSQQQQNALQDAWERDREDENNNKSLANLNTHTIRMSRLSRRSLRSSARSITSIKRENNAKARDEKCAPHDYSMYANSKVFNSDLSFLRTEEEVDDEFIDATLKKFVNCVNFLNGGDDQSTKKN